MPRLIAFILVSILFLVFMFFNLDNKCDVSLGFRIFPQIPVFLTAFSSFVLGMLFSVLFVVSFGGRRKKTAQTGTPPVRGTKKNPGRKDKNSRNTDPATDGTFSESGTPAGTSAVTDYGQPEGGGFFQKLSARRKAANLSPEAGVSPPVDEIKKENSSYGID